MGEYYYKGYLIQEDANGYFYIDDVEFPSMAEAMDWIDETETRPVKSQPVMHTYLFFYVDKATDLSFQAKIVAKNYQEAKKLLYEDYDVYHIAGYEILD